MVGEAAPSMMPLGRTYALLPTTAAATSLTALGGYCSRQIDVCQVILCDLIAREEVGQMAGERIRDTGTSPFVTRELRAIHAMVITNRDRYRTFVTAHITAAKDAVLCHEQGPDLAWELPEVVRLIRDVRPSDPCIRLRNPITFIDGKLLFGIEIQIA